MNTDELIEIIKTYQREYIVDTENMNYNDPTLYDYAEGIIDACNFILNKIQ